MRPAPSFSLTEGRPSALFQFYLDDLVSAAIATTSGLSIRDDVQKHAARLDDALAAFLTMLRSAILHRSACDVSNITVFLTPEGFVSSMHMNNECSHDGTSKGAKFLYENVRAEFASAHMVDWCESAFPKSVEAYAAAVTTKIPETGSIRKSTTATAKKK